MGRGRAAGEAGGGACPYCGALAGGFEPGRLLEHLETEHAYESGPADCPLCGESAEEGAALTEHLLEEHWGACRGAFGRAADFEEAMRAGGRWPPPTLRGTPPGFAAAAAAAAAAGPSGAAFFAVGGDGLDAPGLGPDQGEWEDAYDDFDGSFMQLLESLPGLRDESLGLRGESLRPVPQRQGSIGEEGAQLAGGSWGDGTDPGGTEESGSSMRRPGECGDGSALESARKISREPSSAQLQELGAQGHYAEALLLSSLGLD